MTSSTANHRPYPTRLDNFVTAPLHPRIAARKATSRFVATVDIGRPLDRAFRIWLIAVSALLLGVSLSLLVLTEQTERFFAWTISPPLTAAFLGAGYAASCVFQLLAAWQKLWIHARIAPLGALLFTSLTLLATLIHLDRFHLDSFIGVFWVSIYAIAPPVMLILLIRQWRMPGADPDRRQPLATWLRLLLGLQALVLVPLGAALFVSPLSVAPLWPWTLTPLTAQATGAWLIAVGAGMVQAVWENDLDRVRIALVSFGVYGALQLAAIARYPDTINWVSPQAWLYAVFPVLLLVSGGLGLARGYAGGHSEPADLS
jgi:hypothetical protein